MMNYKLWLRSLLLAVFLFVFLNLYGAKVIEDRNKEILYGNTIGRIESLGWGKSYIEAVKIYEERKSKGICFNQYFQELMRKKYGEFKDEK